MSIVSRIQPRAAMTAIQEQLLREVYGSYHTESGLTVSSDTAMRLITVQSCVRLRASTLSRLPCHVMETDGQTKKKAVNFYLYEKLLHQPNSWLSAANFWAMAEAHVSLRGNFYAYKIGLPGRPIQALIPLKAGRVEKVTQNPDYTLTYDVRFPDNIIRQVGQDKIFHIRGLTLDGIVGLNPIEYAREAIGKGLASEKHLAKWFANGLHPSAVIKHKLPLNSPGYASLKANLKEKYQGLGQDYEFMLLDEDMGIEFPSVKMVDAQFLEQMKLSEAQICGMFRVPLMLVGAGDKSPTYASSEQFMLFYQMFSIDVSSYEEDIRRDLLLPAERERYYAKFQMRALQRGSFKEQMEGFQVAVNAEIINPNEARDLIDMNPYAGGDEYRTRTSTVRDPANQGGAAK